MKMIGLFALMALFLNNGLTFSQTKENPNKARKILTYLEERRDPAISTLFSIIPGGGHFYNRDYGLGVAFFVVRMYCLIESNAILRFWPRKRDRDSPWADRTSHYSATYQYFNIPLAAIDMTIANKRAKYINKKLKEKLNVSTSFDNYNFNIMFSYMF